MRESPLAATAWPFIAGPAENPRQPIGLTWAADGLTPPEEIRVDGERQRVEWRAQPGAAPQAVVFVPLGGTARTVRLTTNDGDTPVEVTCAVEPPRRWELFLVNHSHVDIGYTEYPDILADAHGDYIAQALDIMTASDDRPDPERYRWTCEASWTVEQFLRRHPGREEEFARRAREGRMELTALYVNMTDLFGVEMLERAIRDATALRDRYGIELISACNYDVNGFGWAVPAILKRAGVRYLDTAINETRSLGVRPRPAPCCWASPDGSDVLLWHSGNYLLGNKLLLHTSRTGAEPLVADQLLGLQRDGYPHDALEVLMSGQTGDSMPPSAAVCDVVAEWNRTWLWPRLRLATTGQWFKHLEATWPRAVERHQKAWPDWWADGNGSALYESALARRTQARLVGLEAQRRLLRDRGIGLDRLDEQYETAWKRLMLFCEHTWGPYEAATAPDSPPARGQWHAKAAHVYAADALTASIEVEQMVAAATVGAVSARASGMTNATLQGTPAGYLASADPAAVLVFNPLPEERDDVVRVHVPGHFCPGARPRLREAGSGRVVPVRVRRYPQEDVVNARHWQVEFLAERLPPHGHRIFWVDAADQAHEADDDAGAASAPAKANGDVLENAHFRVELDARNGGMRSIRHKASGREIVQRSSDYLLNQAIYERVDAPDDRYAVASWRGIGRGGVPFARTTLTAADDAIVESSPFSSGLVVHAADPHGLRLTTRITLYDKDDRIDIINTLDKPPVARAEALYHAFPLATPRGQIHLDVAGGIMRPGIDQVEGTATDWHSIQNWFAVAEDDYAVVVASPDVPLVQCGGINTGLWRRTLPASNGLVMSWALNNYWFTNFPVRQGGQVTYAYSITMQDGAFDPARAARFGAEMRQRAWGQAVRLSPRAARS